MYYSVEGGEGWTTSDFFLFWAAAPRGVEVLEVLEWGKIPYVRPLWLAPAGGP